MENFKEFAENTTVPPPVKTIWNDNYFPLQELNKEIRSNQTHNKIRKMRKRFLKRKKAKSKKQAKPEMIWDDRWYPEYSLKKAMEEAKFRRVKCFLFIDYYGNKNLYTKSYYRINQTARQIFWKKVKYF